MATAPVSRKLNLTRDQLANFLSDQQQIKQFEMLFAAVDELQVIVGTDFEYQADTAAANANNALAQISALAQDTSVNDAALNAKVQQALDAIPGLAQALELLALAPRPELGTIASQNSDNVNITGGLISGLDAPLPIASGGTNGTSVPTAGAVPYGTGTTYGFTAAGTAGQVLTSNGAGVPTWTTNAGGDVTGPASSTDNAIARFDGTTGKLIQNSVTTIDDTGNASGILSQQFSNGSAVTLAAGKFWYDGSTGAWNMGMGNGNITQQVGEEIFVYGKASAAITDSPLQIVYHTGVVGASGVIKFAPTIAGITDVNSIVGVATESLALNDFGRVTAFGVVRGITTNGTAFGETWADDDAIWYNPVTGNPTNVKPVAPYVKIQVGLVIKAGAGSSGSFQVEINRGSALGGTDSNVQLGTLANKDLLAYSSSLGYWTNSSFSTLGLGSVTSVSVASANGFAGTVATATTTPAITISTSITGLLKGNGTAISAAVANTDYQGVAAPVTKTANFTVANGEIWYINNKTGSTCTVTLPAASSWSGRQLSFKNMQAQTLVSASSNVVPIDSTSAGTAILLGVIGNWATMVSDGTNWVIMQSAPNNILLLE